MRKIFIKNAGYKKMNYIDYKYMSISKKEKKVKKKLLLKRIKRDIFSLIIISTILLIFYLIIVKISKKYKYNTNVTSNSINFDDYYHNLSLNYTTQNYTLKDLQNDDLKKYLDYMDKAKLGIFLNKKNLIKSENPKISVVISIYNREDYVNSTIRSVQNQNLSEIEIIIIDDFSKDNTTKYVKEMQKIDPRIVIYKNKKNMGTLYSKSIGVLKAKGEYIYSLDSDDMMCEENYLSSIYEEAIKENYDYIQCDAIYLDEVKKIIYKRTPNWVVLWSKLIKTKSYQRAIYKLGKDVLTNKVVVLDDDVIAIHLFLYAKKKKLDKIGVCHFTHFGYHVYFNQFMNNENTKRYCINMINTIDAFYKMKQINYGNHLFKYLYLWGRCKKFLNIPEAQKIVEDFKMYNSTKKK